MTARLAPPRAGQPGRSGRWPRLSALLTLLLVLSWTYSARAAGPAVTFSLGVANQVVAGAWNPLRVETRDLPPSTLSLVIDVGTLRDGQIPVTVTHELRGGGGVFMFEADLFVPPFRSLAWRVATADRVLASGSLSSREADTRDLVLALSDGRASAAIGRLRAAVPGSRFVEVRPSELPVTPAGFDGVNVLFVDLPAPPVDALVAAAVAGVRVVLLQGETDLSPGLSALLAGGDSARLGAGAIALVPNGDAAAASGAGLATLRPGELLLATLAEPLVSVPEPVPVGGVLIASAAYAVLALMLLRFGGGPGLISALLVAVLAGFGAWRALRPPVPPYESALALGVIGGPLALLHEARESVTLPPAVLDFEPGASPIRPQAYSGDDRGVHVPTAAWRSVTMRLPPRAVSAPLAIDGSSIRNTSRLPLTNLYVTGLGSQPDLVPGASAKLEIGEQGAFPPRYLSLVPLLPDGTLIAQSGCGGDGSCALWLADTGPTNVSSGSSFEPFQVLASAAEVGP